MAATRVSYVLKRASLSGIGKLDQMKYIRLLFALQSGEEGEIFLIIPIVDGTQYETTHILR